MATSKKKDRIQNLMQLRNTLAGGLVIRFTIYAWDAESYRDFADAADTQPIAVIDADITWRELRLLELATRKTLACIDVETNMVALMVTNDADNKTFPLSKLLSVVGDAPNPQKVAEDIHMELTTITLTVDNDDITTLMKLLPLGNSSHSGLREKLHQASLTINKKQ